MTKKSNELIFALTNNIQIQILFSKSWPGVSSKKILNNENLNRMIYIFFNSIPVDADAEMRERGNNLFFKIQFD